MVAGNLIMALGIGLVYTLDMNSTPRYWISYQIIAGIGRGMAAQIPIIANQAAVELSSDIPSVTAMTLCKLCLNVKANPLLTYEE